MFRHQRAAVSHLWDSLIRSCTLTLDIMNHLANLLFRNVIIEVNLFDGQKLFIFNSMLKKLSANMMSCSCFHWRFSVVFLHKAEDELNYTACEVVPSLPLFSGRISHLLAFKQMPAVPANWSPCCELESDE